MTSPPFHGGWMSKVNSPALNRGLLIMTTDIFGDALDQDDESARNAELFLEADRLEAIAYKLLDSQSDDASAWDKFTHAKALADAKRAEACQAWMRLKSQLKP
jgi:hypothetical protein